MSDRVCSSCGSVNTGPNVYCVQCGGILENVQSGASASIPSTTAVAKRRHVRIEADRPEPPSLFSRIKGLLLYLMWVAIGVIVVLCLMAPKSVTLPLQEVPNARDVARKIMASSRYAPAGISQQVVNSCLAQQGPVTLESPVNLIPMPVWESSRVGIDAGTVTLFTTLSMMGRPFHVSETFRLEGAPGAWNLVPEAASIGLLDLPRQLFPLIKALLRPGFGSFSEDLNTLSASRKIVIRPGLVEVSPR